MSEFETFSFFNKGWTGENEKTFAVLDSRGRQPHLVLLATANTEEDFIVSHKTTLQHFLLPKF